MCRWIFVTDWITLSEGLQLWLDRFGTRTEGEVIYALLFAGSVTSCVPLVLLQIPFELFVMGAAAVVKSDALFSLVPNWWFCVEYRK